MCDILISMFCCFSADCAISFVQPTYLADENVLNGEVSVCLRLDGITTSDVSVSFSTLNTPGSATRKYKCIKNIIHVILHLTISILKHYLSLIFHYSY